jgi:Ca2+-binding RTX toxin-like protein
MKKHVFFQIILFGLIVLILVSVAAAFAAGLFIEPSNVDLKSIPVNAEDLKPSACSALTLTNIIRGSGTFTGTASSDLILGSSGNDTIDGGGGDDCILGAGGDDNITGGDATDVCIGGLGINSFDTCETIINP